MIQNAVHMVCTCQYREFKAGGHNSENMQLIGGYF